MTENNQKGSIKLPPNYFSGTKHDYSNWIIAWFREAIQNSVDAKAKNIDFKIEVDPDKPDSIRVSCQDDGVGMDKRILFDVFLALGGSEKGENAIGGFGHAKILLAFAHLNYEIETQGVKVNGISDQYDWIETEPKKGVRLQVDMDTKDVSEYRLSSSLHDIVHHSEFKSDVRITLNGETLLSKEKAHPYKQDTVLGHLTFKDMPHGYNSSSLWVRMNGLAMFNASLWSKGDTAFEGYLDLSGASKEVLTSNRDGLTKENTRVLNELLQTLANDREKLKLSGDIDILLNEKEFSLNDFSESDQQYIRTESSRQNLTSEEYLERLMATADDDASELAKNPFKSLIDDVMKAKRKRDNDISDIPANWYPTNFKVKFADGDVKPEDTHKFASKITATMSKKRVGKLAAGWTSIVKTLLENEKYREALGVHKANNGEFYRNEHLIQTGFVFGKPAGLNVSEDDKKRISIMMNPDHVIEKDYDVGDLVALAQHELTHIAVSSHYESFTTAEFEVRRIARRMGTRTFELAFKDASAQWRGEHSSGKAAEKRHIVREVGQEYGY